MTDRSEHVSVLAMDSDSLQVLAPDAIAKRLLAWARSGVSNVADKDSAQSVAISAQVLKTLGIVDSAPLGRDSGSSLEDEVRQFLDYSLTKLQPDGDWLVVRGWPITKFSQYEHLARVKDLVDEDRSGALRDALGFDYVVAPDVVVGIASERPFLHASVSCKWTIRSDRVQNIRHEANMLLRHRRGRAPHIVAVTAEPLPSRLASIARGTGELDAVYHLVLPTLQAAVAQVGNSGQLAVLDELVAHRRLLPLEDLPRNLAR